ILVREQLRDHVDLACIRPLVPGRVMARLEGVSNPASVLAGVMSEWVASRLAEGRLDAMMASPMEALVGVLVDNQGGLEELHRAPVAFVAGALIKQALLCSRGTPRCVLVPTMNFAAPLVVAGLSLGMLGIEEAGVEIEDPFALDPNHLPLEQICDKIRRDV